MAEQITEIASRNIIRLSNEESKRVTRDCIEKALVLLLDKKEFSEVSISEIVKRAGVSRTAFYRNYESKEQVLQEALHGAIDKIINSVPDDTGNEQFWRSLFTAVEEYTGHLKLLLKAGLGNTVLDQITGHMVSRNNSDDPEDRYKRIFLAGAIYNMLVYWVQSDAGETIEEMVAHCVYTTQNPGL